MQTYDCRDSKDDSAIVPAIGHWWDSEISESWNGYVFVNLWGQYGYEFIDAVIIDLPEPVSMSLLALGGLALIRRRV